MPVNSVSDQIQCAIGIEPFLTVVTALNGLQHGDLLWSKCWVTWQHGCLSF